MATVGRVSLELGKPSVAVPVAARMAMMTASERREGRRGRRLCTAEAVALRQLFRYVALRQPRP